MTTTEKRKRYWPYVLVAAALISTVNSIQAITINNTDGWIEITNVNNTNYTINFNSTRLSSGNTTGTGTANYLAKWSNTTNIQSSSVYDNGSLLNITTNIYANTIGNKTFIIGDNKSNNTFPINVNTGSFSVDVIINSKFFVWDGDNTNTHGVFGAARSGAAANFFGITSGGTVTTPTRLTQGQSVFEILAAGYDGTNYGRPGFLTFAIDSSYNTTTNSTPGQIVFQTSPVNTNSPTTRLIIRHNGTVGIGTSSPAQLLHVQGNTSLTNQSVLRLQDAEVCDIDPDAAGLTVVCSSDSRLKQDIRNVTAETADNIRNNVINIPLKEYSMKGDSETIVGVIAQELQVSNPELVRSIVVDKEEYYLDNTDLTIKQRVVSKDTQLAVKQPSMWEIVYLLQEQEKKILELENRISILEEAKV